MASYRFCRSDDVALLVDAWNACYRVHFPELPRMTIETFRVLVRELNLWTSSCMVAAEDGAPIAVVFATKRDDAALIHSIGVHPGHRRQEHGSHLLRSLSAKSAILGPPRIVAEIPARNEGARRFFESCGFVLEETRVDLELDEIPRDPPRGAELVFATSIEELLANDAFRDDARRCWERSPRTLQNRKGELRGLAVASEERIEAYLLHDETADGLRRRVVALECAESARRELWFDLLLRTFLTQDPRPVTIPQVAPEELPAGLLRALGFAAVRDTLALAAEPVPA